MTVQLRDHSGEAEGLWRHVYARVRELLHPHHWEHEPGGKDEVRHALGNHVNVTITSPSDGQVIKYDNATSMWVNGTGGGGGSHQGGYTLSLPATNVPPGPTNLGTSKTITIMRCESDGEVTITVTPPGGDDGTFEISAGGGAILHDNLTAAWANGMTFSFNVSYQGGDGTYLNIDWEFDDA